MHPTNLNHPKIVWQCRGVLVLSLWRVRLRAHMCAWTAHLMMIGNPWGTRLLQHRSTSLTCSIQKVVTLLLAQCQYILCVQSDSNPPPPGYMLIILTTWTRWSTHVCTPPSYLQDEWTSICLLFFIHTLKKQTCSMIHTYPLQGRLTVRMYLI